MATPIQVTIGVAFGYTGGKSCQAVYDYAEANYPGYTEDTTIDVLTWCEGLRAIGLSMHANHGLYHGLSVAQQKTFINWALTQIIAYTPAGYSRRAAMIQLKADLADYIAAPTVQKKNALLATAKAIKPVTSIPAEVYVANAFKGITNAVANNVVTGEIIRDLVRDLKQAAIRLNGLTSLQVEDAILTKLERIIGVV